MLINGVYNYVEVGASPALKTKIYVVETSKNNLNEYTKKFNTEDTEQQEKLEVENGIWLAIDGLPTSHPSYLPFTVVVDVSKDLRNELDGGRKGITKYRKDQIIDKVKSLLKNEKFIDYRQYVSGTETRITTNGYDPRKELYNLLHQKQFFDQVELTQKYFPINNEQEVLTLFTELISKDYLKGFKQKVISSYEVYDGLFEYICEFGNKLLLENDALGLSKKVVDENSTIQEDVVIEFKTTFKLIFRDLQEAKKRLHDIDILVCWNVEFEKVNEYVENHGVVLKEADQSDNYYYGVTHELVGYGRNSSALPVIELKEIINKKFEINI